MKPVYFALAIIFALLGTYFHCKENSTPKEKCSAIKVYGQPKDLMMLAYNCQKKELKFVNYYEFEKLPATCTCCLKDEYDDNKCFVILNSPVVGGREVLIRWKDGRIEIISKLDAEEKYHCSPISIQI